MSGVFLWLSALAVAAALAIGLTAVGSAAIDDAQAATAADAAALAGAAAGPDAARDAAKRNGATVVSVVVDGDVTTVIVRLGQARATAHAKRILVPIS